MIRSIIQQPNPTLDLLFERIVDVSERAYGRHGPHPSNSRNGLPPRHGKPSIAKSIFAPAVPFAP